jgi:Cys-rich protein (TIGR01571 family)
MKRTAAIFFALGVTAAHGGVSSFTDSVEASRKQQSFRGSAVSNNKDVPTPVVNHVKHRGHGYTNGSPLYKKQEAMKSHVSQEEFSPSVAVPVIASEDGWAPLSSYLPVWVPGQPEVLSKKQGLWGSLAYIILIFLIAYMYRQTRYEVLKPETVAYNGDDFTFGFCEVTGCHRDWKLCCWAWWCPGIRWADTVSHDKVRMLKFWAALAAFLILTVILEASYGVSACLLACGGIYFRQRLRGYFGHGRMTFRTLALDALAWCCCPFCAIVQEAREVEHVQLKR